MSFISFAQNFEDVMLWRALGRMEHGFYIDVGAQSPDLDSVTRAFSDAGWSGINVEPHPLYHTELMRRRPRDVNLPCALGDRSHKRAMHLVGATGLSTLDDAIASRHQGAGYELEVIEVDVRTLKDVWHEYVPHGQAVHFLKVDVEGFELQVLKGGDWKSHRPWILVVEATAPNSQVPVYAEWAPLLLNSDYDFVYEDGLNRYYVAREHAHLKQSFEHPPNVFDDFVPAQLVAVRRDLDEMRTTLAVTREAQNEAETSLRVARSAQIEAENSLDAERGQRVVLQQELNETLAQLAMSTKQHDAVAQEVAVQRQQMALQHDMSLKRDELLQAEIQSLKEDFLRVDGEARDARRQAEVFKEALALVYRSRSWRVTAPFRLLAGLLGRRFDS